MSIQDFYMNTTWRQSQNILKGYQTRNKNDFERQMLTMRPISTMVYNFLSESKKSEKELFPLEIDKHIEEAQQEKDKFKNQLPDEVFQAYFRSVFHDKLNGNGR